MFKRYQRTANIYFKFNDVSVVASVGDTVAGALLCSGLGETLSFARQFRPYCQMGSCYGCQVKLNGKTVQACMTPVEEGMEIQSLELTDE